MTDSIGSPIRLRVGYHDGQYGVFWAWPVDGYFDVHHAPRGIAPAGDDVVSELHPTVEDAYAFATDWHNSDMKVITRRMFG